MNFVTAGTYKFSLRRWPVESGLALGSEILDGVEATAYTNKIIDGKAMQFVKAHLIIDDQHVESVVNNQAESATLEMTVPGGETELLAYFDMEDGVECNAFYVYVELLK